MERPFQDAVKTCELEDQLHERDVELTESRLQSLASSHRIEQLQEKVSDLEVLQHTYTHRERKRERRMLINSDKEQRWTENEA